MDQGNRKYKTGCLSREHTVNALEARESKVSLKNFGIIVIAEGYMAQIMKDLVAILVGFGLQILYSNGSY